MAVMGNPNSVTVVTSEVQERNIADVLGQDSATVVGVFTCHIKNSCPMGAECGLGVEMDERPISLLSGVQLGSFVTDTTVSCAAKECAKPDNVQVLADTIKRAAGQLPHIPSSFQDADQTVAC